MNCDSQSIIGRTQSNLYNGKSWHIRRWHNIVGQLLSNGVINIDYVKSKDNLVDPFTKGLSREQIYKSLRGMGLKHHKRIPNLAKWRSQGLDSMGQRK